MSQLLYVAGLDNISEVEPDVTHPQSNSTSVRYEGQTIRIRVVYSGDQTKWDEKDRFGTYMYYVSKNDMQAQFSFIDQTEINGTVQSRIEYDLHGIQILFNQDADLKIFDLRTLFVSLLSGTCIRVLPYDRVKQYADCSTRMRIVQVRRY